MYKKNRVASYMEDELKIRSRSIYGDYYYKKYSNHRKNKKNSYKSLPEDEQGPDDEENESGLWNCVKKTAKKIRTFVTYPMSTIF